MHHRPTLLLLSLAALGGCTQAGPPGTATAAAGGARQCFLPSQVNGFDSVDRYTVDVTIGVKQVYRLQLVGTCPDVDWSQRIGIRSSGGGNWVCQGLDAELIVPGPTGVQRCPVTTVRRLSEEEVAAARARRR